MGGLRGVGVDILANSKAILDPRGGVWVWHLVFNMLEICKQMPLM